MNLWSGHLFADIWLAIELGMVALMLIMLLISPFFD